MSKVVKNSDGKQDQKDQSDWDVPPSERGKGESMTFDQKTPGSVFGLVGLSYMIVLVLGLIALALWLLL